MPTGAEAGWPGYAVEFWQGLFVPAATPPPVVARLHRAAEGAAQAAALLADMAARGITIAASAPAELGRLLAEETAAWTRLAEATGLTAE